MFRGWAQLNGQEVANTSRVLSHMGVITPTSDDEIGSPMECACEVETPYDDSWPGLRAELGQAPYVITNAPWYNAARPESAEFAGIWIMDVTGVDSVPVQRDVAQSLCVGGVASPSRDAARTITFSALVVACTNAGARYGLDWLSCILREGTTRGGVDLQYFKAHPADTAADPGSLRRTMFGMVLTAAPVVSETSGRSKGRPHRQATIFRVDWEMVATNPYAYGDSTVTSVVWDSITAEGIEWAHAPDCDDTSSCGLPTVYNADCMPPQITVATAAIPTCGGCLPVCEIERRVWEMPTQFGNCDDTVVTVQVANTSETDTLTVIMYWQPCGSTDICEREGALQVSGLAPGHTAIADSVTGRPFVMVDDVPHRQVGIVSTPSGRPWTPTTLESLTCWELVAESAPGASYDVVIETRDKDA